MVDGQMPLYKATGSPKLLALASRWRNDGWAGLTPR